MEWTRERPTIEGWYWLIETRQYRSAPPSTDPPQVVHVTDCCYIDGGLGVWMTETEIQQPLASIDTRSYWLGPLPVPAQEKVKP